MRHSPAEASFYYCERIAPNGSPVRFPSDRALNLNPFEWPAGAKAGTWLIRYCRDAQGRVVIPNTHGKVQVVATLTYPAEVYDQPEGASDDVLMQVLEEKAEEAEDDEEGSLKATRIDAKKREIAIDLTAKEQKLVRRAAVNKELAEGYLLNRAHRMEVRDQSEAMFRPFKVLRVGGAAPDSVRPAITPDLRTIPPDSIRDLAIAAPLSPALRRYGATLELPGASLAACAELLP